MRRMTKLAMISSKFMKPNSPKHWETFEEYVDDSVDTEGCSSTFNWYQYLFN